MGESLWSRKALAGQPVGAFQHRGVDALVQASAVRRAINDQLRTGTDKGNLTV